MKNNSIVYVLPDYNNEFQQWELYILTLNATVLRYTLLGDLLGSYSHPNLVRTPFAKLFSLPSINSSEKLIFCLNSTGETVAWAVTGEVIPAWTKILDRPSTGGTWTINYPLLADVTENGKLDIILVGKEPNKIYIFNSSGEILPGWPQTLPYPEISYISTVPVIMDVNQDGTIEILFSLNVGLFRFYDFLGNLSSVWDQPPPIAESQFNDFLIGDITGDNRCEIIYSGRGSKGWGTVYAVETGWVGHGPWVRFREPNANIFLDSDNDHLSDEEEQFFGTNKNLNDTDKDRLSDYTEMIYSFTDPLIADTDVDGLLDGEEVMKYGTDPTESDTDKDELSDAEEVLMYGTDPTQSDSDADGLLDGEEVTKYGTDPTESDTDKDELSDTEEVLTYGTNPTDPDSDNDGLLDGEEILIHKTDPTDPDTDNDGLSDGEEVKQHGTNPLKADTDGDGVPDGVEVFFSLNPLDSGDIFIIIWGIIGIVLVIIFMAGFQTLRVRRLNWLRQTWMTILQDQYIAPINISKKAAEIHLSPERGKTWLEDFLARGTPEGISGLYNPEQQIFLSFKTLQLWLETLNEIPLESLAASLDLPLERIESQLKELAQVKSGEWILTDDLLLRS